MRLALLLLGFFIAFAASLTERKCGKDPDDCNLGFMHVNDCQNPKNVSEHKGVDREVLDNIRIFSQFAAASYWPGNNNSTGDLLKCSGPSCPKIPHGNCPDVEKGEYTTVSEWEDMAGFDDHGYIAISNNDKLIVLALRGSQSHQNWAENLKTNMVDASAFCDCCQVHHGFWESWTGISKTVIQLLAKLHDDNPDYRVVVTGHSLGGAEATLAAGEIRLQGSWWSDNVELYSYGSPRVGNTATVRFLSQQSDKSYRVTATKDPIPRLPFTRLGYQHTSPEYWISSHPDNPNTYDVVVLSGYFNPHGANQFDMLGDGFDMDFHRHYFGYISGCDPDPPEDPSIRDIGGRFF